MSKEPKGDLYVPHTPQGLRQTTAPRGCGLATPPAPGPAHEAHRGLLSCARSGLDRDPDLLARTACQVPGSHGHVPSTGHTGSGPVHLGRESCTNRLPRVRRVWSAQEATRSPRRGSHKPGRGVLGDAVSKASAHCKHSWKMNRS